MSRRNLITCPVFIIISTLYERAKKKRCPEGVRRDRDAGRGLSKWSKRKKSDY